MLIESSKRVALNSGRYFVRTTGASGNVSVVLDIEGETGDAITPDPEGEIWTVPPCYIDVTISGDYKLSISPASVNESP